MHYSTHKFIIEDIILIFVNILSFYYLIVPDSSIMLCKKKFKYPEYPRTYHLDYKNNTFDYPAVDLLYYLTAK